MTHKLKTSNCYFKKIWSGEKNFELRKNDRDFKVGDMLYLFDYDNDIQSFNTRMIRCKISYILKDIAFGIEEGYCIMALTSIDRIE